MLLDGVVGRDDDEHRPTRSVLRGFNILSNLLQFTLSRYQMAGNVIEREKMGRGRIKIMTEAAISAGALWMHHCHHAKFILKSVLRFCTTREFGRGEGWMFPSRSNPHVFLQFIRQKMQENYLCGDVTANVSRCEPFHFTTLPSASPVYGPPPDGSKAMLSGPNISLLNLTFACFKVLL